MRTALMITMSDYDGTVTDTRPSVTCGFCGQTHHSVFAVRECHQGAAIRECDDLVMVDSEDGPMAVDCGHEAAFTEHGFTCVAGHSYVDIETREAQEWDYAGDEYDAAVIMRGGREFAPMGPNTLLDDRLVAHIAANL